jgi:hypothetical protein
MKTCHIVTYSVMNLLLLQRNSLMLEVLPTFTAPFNGCHSLSCEWEMRCVWCFGVFKTFYDICDNFFSVAVIFDQIDSKYDGPSYPPKISGTTGRLTTARHLLGCDSFPCYILACLQNTDTDDSLQNHRIFASVCGYSSVSRNLNCVPIVSNFTMGTTKSHGVVTVWLFRVLHNK